MPQIRVNDTSIHYGWDGPEAGPVVMLSHSLAIRPEDVGSAGETVGRSRLPGPSVRPSRSWSIAGGPRGLLHRNTGR